MSTETSRAKAVYIQGKEAEPGVYRAQDEVTLLRASLEGDTQAWGEIITRYKDAVFGLCLGFLRNRADAEDLTHDAFVRAYLNLRRYRLEKRFSTWLFTIASNLCRNRLRYRRYHPVVSAPDQMEGGGDPGRAVAREDRIGKIREMLDRLPHSYRAPLVLRYYNDLSYKEIAEVLFLREGTVKTRIHRAKLMLKDALEKDGVIQHESG
jgi:RNA polymerase sigma-70 factor, ECF subfamily